MNPFVLKYHPDYFCDREKDLSRLNDNVLNGINTLVHSPRRLGKSALLRHFIFKLENKRKYETLYVDLFATSNLNDFAKVLGEAVLKKYFFKNILDGVKNLFAGIKASVSFSPDGMPLLDMGLDDTQVNSSLNEIFDYLEKRKKKVIIAFDEFQEVANYPEKAEAYLRTKAQELRNIHFIFSGSSGHILQNMFFGPKQPFYQSVDSIALDKIPEQKYFNFIKKCFSDAGKSISKSAINFLLEFTQTHTYYTQLLCNQCFYKTEKDLTEDKAKEIAYSYIEDHKIDYRSVLILIPARQAKVLQAISKEEYVGQPTSMEFIMKHKLSSPSSVLQAVNALEKKELILRTDNGFKTYDVFLKRFIEMFY